MTNLHFPVLDTLPLLNQALNEHPQCILVAPPGAGKTTQIPLSLLNADWLAGQGILMLEPRRLAARMAATYMASQLGQEAGRTVGYTVRFDRKVSKNTRIEVVTEGVLTRRLQSDPGLEGIGLVIFDEFHERNLNSDLGLALTTDIQQGLRGDLRLLVMSATLETGRLRSYFNNAPEIISEGKQFPVTHHYLDRNPDDDKLQAVLMQTVQRALAEHDGDMLIFFAGVAEIEWAREQLQTRLSSQAVDVLPLHGSLSLAQQDRVMQPAAEGRRKVILATNIAETSLTIDGLKIIVDTGFMRETRFRADSGMTQLHTVRVTADSAAQRCGRSGRQGPGQCYRLWSKHTQSGLVPERSPEILRTDLTSLVLELACWGITDMSQLNWLDTPPAAHVNQARQLLTQLGAIDSQGRVTKPGRDMASLSMNPRLAAMVVKAEPEDAWLACVLAALTEERDIMRDQNFGSMEARIQHVSSNQAGHMGKRVLDIARRHARKAGICPDGLDERHAGRLLALAFPDRVARARKDGEGKRYLLCNGRGAKLHALDNMPSSDFIVITDIDDRRGDGRIFRYAQLSDEDVNAISEKSSATSEEVAWDEKNNRLVARKVTRLGAIELDSRPQENMTDEHAIPLLLDVIRKSELARLPWTAAARNMQARIQLAAELETGWPDVSDQNLLCEMDKWLTPFLGGMRSQADMDKLNMATLLRSQLDWNQQQWLEQHLPERFQLPAGRKVAIDYCHQPLPLIRSRVQDFFGLTQQPRLASGRVEVIIELLSPANRPVQRTQDIAGFWRGSYAEVRKEMKGRYPKHDWPENPA